MEESVDTATRTTLQQTAPTLPPERIDCSSSSSVTVVVVVVVHNFFPRCCCCYTPTRCCCCCCCWTAGLLLLLRRRVRRMTVRSSAIRRRIHTHTAAAGTVKYYEWEDTGTTKIENHQPKKPKLHDDDNDAVKVFVPEVFFYRLYRCRLSSTRTPTPARAADCFCVRLVSGVWRPRHRMGNRAVFTHSLVQKIRHSDVENRRMPSTPNYLKHIFFHAIAVGWRFCGGDPPPGQFCFHENNNERWRRR